MAPTSRSLTPELDAAIELADGRMLSYGVLGDPGAATVVVVLDGPGSRGLARAAGPVAADRGLRLIAPDRPGFGRSTPLADRRFADVAADVLALADALRAQRFGILAQSGGTPYALAVAAAAPARVTGLALVGAVSPLGEPDALADVSGPMRMPFMAARRAPWLLRPLFEVAARSTRRDPERSARRFAGSAPPADRAALEDPRLWQLHVRTTAESLEAPAEWAREAALLARPWPIDLGAIRAPVALWVGEKDVTHPPVMSRRLAARLGGAPVHVVPGAATFAMLPVFGDVLAFAAGAPPVPEARPA
jgi:pimeloyl-ACP methyl ester carboxylesterase